MTGPPETTTRCLKCSTNRRESDQLGHVVSIQTSPSLAHMPTLKEPKKTLWTTTSTAVKKWAVTRTLAASTSPL